MGRRHIAVGLVAALTLVGAGRASAQEVVRTDTGVEMRTIDGGRIAVTLPCPSQGMARLGPRLYLAAGRCGVVRLEVAADGFVRADQLLVGLDVVGIGPREGGVYAQVRDLGPRFVDALSLPWAAGGIGGPEIRAVHSDAAQEFAAPDVDTASTAPLVLRVQRSPSPPPNRRVATPPRRGDSWEMGGEAFAFFGTSSGWGFGLLARSWLVYRASIPLAVRLDLTPVGVVISDAPYGTALGLASVDLDFEGFALGFGIGGTSFHESYAPNDSPALAFGGHLRLGVTDGLAFSVRSGFHLGDDGGARFSFLEGVLDTPLTQMVAVFFRGSIAIDPIRAQLDHGMRVWILGHGEAGSVALRVTFGWAIERGYVPPTCGAPCSARPFDLSGFGGGLGVEGRM
ncbi:MAG: hypothetical protein KC619_28645 [Myxococcales bacterium]|nr:hypothetical protein [Myxococcales bacterium]